MRPTVGLPDGRLLPTGLLATFLGLLALAAWYRRRRAGAPAVPWVLTAAPLTSSVGQRLVPGMKGWLAAVASGRLRGDEGDRVAPVLARLEEVSSQRGWAAPVVRAVHETEGDLVISLAASPDVAQGLVGLAGPDLARTMVCAASRVRATRQGVVLELDGVPAALRSVSPPDGSDGQQVPAAAWGPAGLPHPYPLLVPLGAPGDGQVLHVNLADLPTLLVACGSQGDAGHCLVTLVTHIVAQARPSQVQLLVAGEAGQRLEMLCGLPHLAAPPADTGDPATLSALLDLAEDALIARMRDRQAPSGQGPHQRPTSRLQTVVLVVDEIAVLLAHPVLLARFDALCRAGADHGFVVLAGTEDVGAFTGTAGEGLLSAFAGRLVGRLDDTAASVAILGEEGAEVLETSTLAWVCRGEGAPQRLSAFSLRESEAREIIAALAAAHSLVSPSPVLAPSADEDINAVEDDADEGNDEAGPAEDAADTTDEAVSVEDQGNEDEAPDAPGFSKPAVITSAPEASPTGSIPVAANQAAAVLAGARQSGDGHTGDGAAPTDEAAGDLVGSTVAPSGGGAACMGDGRQPHLWARAHADAPISLRVLGGLDVAIEGQVVCEGLPKNAREYLAYLALQRGAARKREVIQEAFWPDAPPVQGAKSIHRVRQKIILTRRRHLV